MEEQSLTPEQEAEFEALSVEWTEQCERVGVDMQAAIPQLREIAPPVEQRVSDDETELTLTVDVSGIVKTLRSLPDSAGTDAFVAAYNARPRGVNSPTA